jgi:adenylyltransferase/sulfurtransferase
MSLTQEELARYSRHLCIPEVGVEGQEKLKAASVLLVGSGGLGSPLALYLAAAGVGRLGLVDFDVVDHSNLQRQILHHTGDVGRKKLDSAQDKLAGINPNVELVPYDVRLNSGNALDILADYDLVIDGTDNFPTRYLVNDACVLLGKPNVYGSIFRFEGQASVFYAKEGPCYRCLYPEPPPPGLVPSCAEGGVLGILPGLVGLIQATEGIKQILGIGESLVGRLLLIDALQMSFREMRLNRDPECPLCGDNPTITGLIDYEQFCNAGAAPETPIDEIDVVELQGLMAADASLQLLDVREPHEVAICRIDGSIVIPLDELGDRADELDRSRPLYVHCKLGGRSAKAVRQLLSSGFSDVTNVAGGIIAWADQVDAEMAKY